MEDTDTPEIDNLELDEEGNEEESPSTVTHFKRGEIARKGNDVTIRLSRGAEIWDGADAALLREMINRVSDGTEPVESISFDIGGVSSMPSGTSQIFCESAEKVKTFLRYPSPAVQHMLWFGIFTKCVVEGTLYEVHPFPLDSNETFSNDTIRNVIPTSATKPKPADESPENPKVIEALNLIAEERRRKTRQQLASQKIESENPPERPDDALADPNEESPADTASQELLS